MTDLPQSIQDDIEGRLEFFSEQQRFHEMMMSLDTDRTNKLIEISMEMHEKMQKKKRECEVLRRQMDEIGEKLTRKREEMHHWMEAQQAIQTKVTQVLEERFEAERIHMENVKTMTNDLIETLESKATDADE